jgi:WD40-like Beta Propeller Repeat
LTGGKTLNPAIPVLLALLLGMSPGVPAQNDPLSLLGPLTDYPSLLAPGFINTGLATRDLTMTSDGREIYFCTNTSGYANAFILVTRFVEGGWTVPEVVSFSGFPDIVDLEPALSPDDQSLYFYSTRPVSEGGEPAQDIWVVHRRVDGWGDPENLGAPVNSDDPEFFPSVTADGTLYFCRADPSTRRHSIFRSRLVAGKFEEPEKLPAQVNSGTSQFNAWISPDETQLIVPVAGHPDNRGAVDYWICRRNPDDTWNDPINLGPLVNDGAAQSWSPSVSPDGKRFFFMSGREVGEAMPWPVSWSELQRRHRSPGCGRPGIFAMKADFLVDPARLSELVAPEGPGSDSVDSGVASPAYKGNPGRCWGQEPPGTTPEIFAPGLVSTGLRERDIVLGSRSDRLMYGVMDLGLATIMVSDWIDGRWSEPISAPWHRDKDFACFEPTLSNDGHSVYFLTNQAAPGQTQGRGWANQNIFVSHWRDGTWSEAAALPAPVTTEAAEYFPSMTADGALYFSREDQEGHPAIWMALPSADGFSEPTRLPAEVNVGQDNYNAFVSRDQGFLIVCVAGHEQNLGAADYWISFRDVKGGWLPAVNMGPDFNQQGTRASSAFLAPDLGVLFFSSNRKKAAPRSAGERLTREDLLIMHTEPGMGSSDLWWVDASVLDDFKMKAVRNRE